MKRLVYILLVFFLVSCGSNMTTGISTEHNDKEVSASGKGTTTSKPEVTIQSILANMTEGNYREGEVLVKFKAGTTKNILSGLHQAVGAVSRESFTLVPNLERVKLPEGVSVEDAIIQYMSDPNVEYAEPNYVIQVLSTIPNDTYFINQWALHNTGSYAGGTDDADIDAPEAWDVTKGDDDIIIAIVDTGIDYNHADLVGNIWQNTGEIDCVDGIDSDGNGYVDDCIGWDFTTCEWFKEDGSCETVKSEDNDPMDDHGHGTHVAGITGAVGNNGEGVAGVMWNVKLMALKFINIQGAGTTADAINAIEYAIANGARIINASWGGYEYSLALYNTINSANSAGILFIAAAGNGGDDSVGDNNDLTPMYPASYELPNIISVAATDQNDLRLSFSNYGLNSVDVAAPGVYIFSTVPNWWDGGGGYGVLEFFAGTSMATPHVSGLAGLIYSYYDGSNNTAFSYTQVRDTILRYVDLLPSLQGWIKTGGRINAHLAVSSLLSPTNLTATTNSPSITLTWVDNATGEDGYKVERKVEGGSFEEIADLPADTTTYTDTALEFLTTYTYRVKAYNNIAESFYSNEASATTPAEEERKSSGGGGCSLIAGQEGQGVDIAILLIPVVAILIALRRRR